MCKGRVVAVAIIEDNRLFREGITALLSQVPEIVVVAADSSLDSPAVQSTEPDIILLDLGLHNADSLRLALRAMNDFPGARVIVMDLLPAHEDIVEYVNAGVSGFITKDATLQELVATICSVADGKKVLPPEMTGSLFSQIARVALAKSPPIALESVRITPREHEVIRLISEGMSNKEIAQALDIAAHTVKSHVRNIMEKLTLHTRLQIAAYVHGRGEAAR